MSDRREIRYESLQDFLDDAESLVNAENVITVGNWNLAQILKHLAINMRLAVDGRLNFKVPWLVKFFMKFKKNQMINGKLKPGIKLPDNVSRLLVPKPTTDLQDAWEMTQKQVQKFSDHTGFAEHPVFGKITDEEWLKLTLRHCELHMSFAKIG